ncbi:MAG: hypothetical protein ACOWW1_09325 [archaeon]|nr:hypothetical protein [Candidatus Bathyarchaeum sp.]
MKTVALFLGFILLLIGTGLWITSAVTSLQEYNQYVELIASQNSGRPLPYYSWEPGKTLNITSIFLAFAWIPLIDYAIRKKSYPYLKQKLTYKGIKRFSRSSSRSLYELLYGIIFGYFSRINHKVGAKIKFWGMKLETFEHVHLLTKVFRWIVLPLSLIHLFLGYFLFGQNFLDTIIIGVVLFFYSNFVPDLPAIFRQKIYGDKRDTLYEKLSSYKTYALLLFAPFFILLVFGGAKIKWKTTETFHNFKSLAIYGTFLFIISLLVLFIFPTSIGGIIETVCVPLYAILGYLTHLKVDLIF